jgi:hypothetical protein
MLQFELGNSKNNPKAYKYISSIIIAVFVAFSVGSFISSGVLHGFGIGSLSVQLSVLGAFLGVVWFLALRYFRPHPSFIKSIFVSWFIGSTVLALYTLISLLFGGGYAAAFWVPTQGWLLLFSANIFLLLAFAMFQKRAVKAIWTTSIVLHLGVLFAWDYSSIWLLLLGGISALLVFQIVYNKKLWQRNFTYPLQIWIIAFLLLVIPIKIFSGNSVPDLSLFSYEAVRTSISVQGLTFFGAGLSKGAQNIALSQTSFIGLEDAVSSSLTDLGIGHGYLQLYLETGVLGIIAWIILLVALLVGGIKFFRKHLDSLKEGSMPEAIYLGAIFWVVIGMVTIGLWFSSFSFVIYWFCMMLFGGAVVLWHSGTEQEIDQKADTRTHINKASSFYPLRIIAVIAVVGYIVFLTVGMRTILAHRLVAGISSLPDARERLDAWLVVTDKNPWNSFYKLSLTGARVSILGTPISIDAQRDNLEKITTTLTKEAGDTSNPLVHWLAAQVYGELQTYAEGSSQLGLEHYQRALQLWPTNVALPVVIAQYYRDHLNNLVSNEVSADDLRALARSGLEQALIQEPEYLPARLELAFLLEDREGATSALSELEPWEEASPEITYHIGRLHFNNGDFGLAAEKFGEVLVRVPSHSNARYSLGIAYFRLEQYDDALTEFEEVARLNPNNPDVQEKINQVQDKINGLVE